MCRLDRRGASRAHLASLFAAVCLVGCGTSPGTLVVRGVQPGSGTRLAGLQVTVLPVDAQAVLDTLARGAVTPRPAFPHLEAEMRAYRRGGEAAAGGAPAGDAWEATRDSVEALADTLRGLSRASVAYREAYERLRGLYDRLGRRAAQRDRTLDAQQGSERNLALRAAGAADSLRRWERTAYADFPQHLEQAVRRTGRDIVQATLDSTGHTRIALAPGRWWVEARLTDPANPFEEYFWSVPVEVSPLAAAIVPLTEWTAHRRWRH